MNSFGSNYSVLDRLDQFVWTSATSGYSWKRLPYSAAFAEWVEGEQHVFLTDGVPIGCPTSVKRYAPLIHTGLFRSFAELDGSRKAICGFANQYGLLTSGEPVILGDKVGNGERIELWRQEIGELKRLLDIWLCLTKEHDAGLLTSAITWQDASVQYNVPGRFLLIASKRSNPALFDSFRRGDVFGPAWEVLRAGVNDHLNASPRLVWNHSSTRLGLYQVPADLRSGIWLQFARAIDGNRDYIRCEECRNWFEISSPDGGRADKQFCGSACRARKWRRTKKSEIEEQKDHAKKKTR
jgi:hypothetical protein